MGRRRELNLWRRWKLTLDAGLAGKIEHLLWDNLTNRPHYGARGDLIEDLLKFWIAKEQGKPESELPHVRSAPELLHKPNIGV